jgi:anti-sigma factor RsiW
MMNLVFAMRCKWTARRLQQYIDMDPAAELSEKEITRVRGHLTECEKCSTSVADYKKISKTLRWFGDNNAPDETMLNRLKLKLNQIAPLTKE